MYQRIFLLSLLYHVQLMLWSLPHGLEYDTEMVTDGELVIKFIAGSCSFNLCQKDNMRFKMYKKPQIWYMLDNPTLS